MVSLQEWDLSKLPDAARRRRLLHPPSAECLLTRLVYEATHAAEKICLKLEPCATPGYSEYSRLHTQLPVNKCTYDLLFNGRSGYRAQYYLSPEEGNVYNRQIIDALAPVIRTACTAKAENVVDPDLVQLSLKSAGKLAWYGSNKDALIFYKYPKILSVPRWNDYWNSKSSCCPMGLIAFMLDNPRVFLKGAFVNADGDVYDNKPDRAKDLHETGWT